MAKKIRSTGGKLVILDWADYNWFYKPLSDISKEKINQQLLNLSKSGVPVVPMASIINMNDPVNFIPTDGHPSATANQIIAQWLATQTTFNN